MNTLTATVYLKSEVSYPSYFRTKMKIKTGLFLLFLLALFSCQTSKIKTELPSGFEIWEGTWQRENTRQFEIWEKNQHHYSGKMIAVENKDTLLLEQIKLVKTDEDIFYEVIVPNQNDAQSVRFKLTKHEKDVFQFENPEHDFPKKIIYTFQGQNQLSAVISGGDKSVEFNFKKQ